MTKYVVGIVGSLLGMLAGVWLILVPFALAFQNQGQDWIDATYVDFWTGIGLLLISLVGVISYALGLTQELRSRGIIERSEGSYGQGAYQQAAGAEGAQASQANMEQVLMPLLTSMLQDMQEQQRKRAESEHTEGQYNDAAPQQRAGAERSQQQ